MFDRIVVGYASDQPGRDAVKLAALIGSAVSGQITIVFPYYPLFSPTTGEAAQERVRDEVRALLEGFEGLAEPTYHWSPSSWPIHALHELASYEKADLIVFGEAREQLADYLHVSLMERMVHGAPCAVAVAPAHYADDTRKLRRVGVGLSVSEEGRTTLLVAQELVAAVAGQMEVIAGVGMDPALASYAFSSPELPQIEQQMYTETQETLARMVGELGERVPVEHQAIKGDPAKVLVERSADLDLLVLGSRAYGPLRHVLLGSVSARAMREARCPVLVIPRGVHPVEACAKLAD